MDLITLFFDFIEAFVQGFVSFSTYVALDNFFEQKEIDDGIRRSN